MIDGNEHLKFNALDDALMVLEARVQTGSKTLMLMPTQEYATYEHRKNKRGKKS